MTDVLDELEEGVRCAGKRIAELRFAEKVDLIDENEDGLQEIKRNYKKGRGSFEEIWNGDYCGEGLSNGCRKR